MKNLKFALTLTFLSTFGCASFSAPKLTPEGARAKLMKADPPATCKELKSVSANSGWGDDGAKTELRNVAGKLGANYVRLETVTKDNSTIYSGTAFKCP